jgi:hypothetical protein
MNIHNDFIANTSSVSPIHAIYDLIFIAIIQYILI